ncbi:unnamed protein product [Ceratitis capitata]|uniref:(Mediterranean fruit fly) hypothetical protein n=1 Tax=Ceratitis capitata TaxID=7213 RepID=A0A811UTK3_CERCA|nr:unnamed protein product [Ceratitis capitata]
MAVSAINVDDKTVIATLLVMALALTWAKMALVESMAQKQQDPTLRAMASPTRKRKTAAPTPTATSGVKTETLIFVLSIVSSLTSRRLLTIGKGYESINKQGYIRPAINLSYRKNDVKLIVRYGFGDVKPVLPTSDTVMTCDIRKEVEMSPFLTHLSNGLLKNFIIHHQTSLVWQENYHPIIEEGWRDQLPLTAFLSTTSNQGGTLPSPPNYYGTVLRWSRRERWTYCLPRACKLSFEEFISEECLIMAAVPQGSVLGQILTSTFSDDTAIL